MKTLAKLAVLTLMACAPAAADSFSLEASAPSSFTGILETAGGVPPSLSIASIESTIFESAASRSFDYEREGYIGTVFVGDGYALQTTNSIPTSTVPEPATMVLLGSGMALAALRRRRALR